MKICMRRHKTRPESDHRSTPRLGLRVRSACIIKAGKLKLQAAEAGRRSSTVMFVACSALENSDGLLSWQLLALDDDLSLSVLCASIVVLLDVDMLGVGGFGALGLRVTHLCTKCNSTVGRLECQTLYKVYLKCWVSPDPVGKPLCDFSSYDRG